MRSIRGLGSILERYDSERNYAAYGYAGTLPQSSSQSHCFALNGDIYNPEVQGIEGIVAAYKRAVKTVDLGYETMFSQFLNRVNGFCSAKPLK